MDLPVAEALWPVPRRRAGSPRRPGPARPPPGVAGGGGIRSSSRPVVGVAAFAIEVPTVAAAGVPDGVSEAGAGSRHRTCPCVLADVQDGGIVAASLVVKPSADGGVQRSQDAAATVLNGCRAQRRRSECRNGPVGAERPAVALVGDVVGRRPVVFSRSGRPTILANASVSDGSSLASTSATSSTTAAGLTASPPSSASTSRPASAPCCSATTQTHPSTPASSFCKPSATPAGQANPLIPRPAPSNTPPPSSSRVSVCMSVATTSSMIYLLLAEALLFSDDWPNTPGRAPLRIVGVIAATKAITMLPTRRLETAALPLRWFGSR